MRGFEQVHLHALCIPGVQNTQEDWKPLQDASFDFLEIDFAHDQPKASKKINPDNWRAQVIKYEKNFAQESNAEIILAHSYGTHRALEVLKETESAKIAFLLCPASNKTRKSIK